MQPLEAASALLLTLIVIAAARRRGGALRVLAAGGLDRRDRLAVLPVAGDARRGDRDAPQRAPAADAGGRARARALARLRAGLRAVRGGGHAAGAGLARRSSTRARSGPSTRPSSSLPNALRVSAIAFGVLAMLALVVAFALRTVSPAQLGCGGAAGRRAGRWPAGSARPSCSSWATCNLVIFLVGVVALCLVAGVPIAFCFGLATLSLPGLHDHRAADRDGRPHGRGHVEHHPGLGADLRAARLRARQHRHGQGHRRLAGRRCSATSRPACPMCCSARCSSSRASRAPRCRTWRPSRRRCSRR